MEEDIKVQQLQQYIEAVDQAVQTITLKAKRGDFSPKSVEEIEYLLANAPDMKAQTYLMLADFRHAYDLARFDTKIIHSELSKQANTQRDALNLTSAKDREAYVVSQEKYKEAVLREIELKYKCDQMQAVAIRYDDLFISVRKLASMLSKEMYEQGV